MHVRWLISRDIPRVLEIEAASFGEKAWQENDFIAWFRGKSNIGLVAEKSNDSSVVIGFVLYTLHKHKLQVVNLAVHPEYRQRGVGSALIAWLKTRLDTGGKNRLVAEVCDDNLEAHLFLKAVGFEAVTVLRGQYDDPAGDAYRFVYRVGMREASGI